jgi:hypothetical protein
VADQSVFPIEIQLVPGNQAPKYDTGHQVSVERVTITEQGTKSRLPLVDFIAHDKDGNQVLFVLTGRQVCAIASSIRGINMRNHGVEEP